MFYDSLHFLLFIDNPHFRRLDHPIECGEFRAMTRQVFYSFHYEADNWRAAQVRNIGSIEGNRPATDNDWETVKRGGSRTIQNWIADQMSFRTCTVVLVGENTAGRAWINYEIRKSWNARMGVAGIHIHRLKDQNGLTSRAGRSPFADIVLGNSGLVLSQIVKCYNPYGWNSKEAYDWISDHIADIVEEAIEIRNSNNILLP